MANLRRHVQIAGLGCHRDWLGLAALDAYDDIEIRLGSSYREISDGVKIYAVIMPFFVEEPAVESAAINIFEPSSDFGGFSLSLQLDRYYRIWDNDINARFEYMGEFLQEFFNIGRVPIFAWYKGGPTSQLDVGTWAARTPTPDWEYIAVRSWQTVPSKNTVLYWGREALLITDIEPFVSVSGSTHRIKFTKRVFGTFHERHGNYQERREDIEIYTKNPMVLSREVTMYDYDVTNDTMHLKGAGYMEQPKDLGGGLMHGISVAVTGRRGRINMQKYSQNRALWFQESASDSDGAYNTLKRSMPLLPLPGNGDKPVSGSNTINSIACKQGDVVVFCNWTEGSRLPGESRTYNVQPIFWGAILGTLVEMTGSGDAKNQGALEEVILAHPSYSHFWFDFGGTYLEHSAHPFDIIRAFLVSTDGKRGSTYDVLPEGWGLGTPDELINHTEIDTLKTGGYGGASWMYIGLSMNLFVAGADSQEEVWQLVDRILKPLLCVHAIDAQGRFTIRTVMDLGPQYVVATYANTEFGQDIKHLSYVKTEYTPVRDIRYNISRRGTGGKYSGEIRATDLRGSLANRYAGLAEDEEISALDYGVVGFVAASWDAIPSGASLLMLAAQRYFLRNSGIHYYRASIVDPTQRLDPLTLINIEHPALINAAGGNGFESRRMMILGHGQDPPEGASLNRVHLMDVTDLNKNAHLIAPGWTPSGTPPGPFTTIRILEQDIDSLRVGMVIYLYDEFFSPYNAGESRTITAYTDTPPFDITIDSAFTKTPTTGDWFILADYILSDPIEVAKYAYLANDAAELGSTPDEAATWGF